MSRKTHGGWSFATAERMLLAVFLLSRVILVWRTYDHGVGWDAGDHLEMIDHWPWEEEVWSVRSHFYAFHPQLGFFLGKALVTLGMHRDAAAQTVAAFAMLGAFFAMRWVLRRFGVLESARGLATLYGGASLPVQVYLAHSINLDALLQAAAIGAIAASIAFVQERTWRAWIMLVVFLVAGLLTKATGVLLLVIPAAVMLCIGRWRNEIWRAGAAAILPSVVACAIVAPYIIVRYVIPEGRVFITNMDMDEYDLWLLEGDRERFAERGALAFAKDLVWGITPGTETLDTRDSVRVRFVNAWKDLWASNASNIRQGGFSFGLSAFFAWVGTALLLLGAWRSVLRPAPAWLGLTRILAILFALQILMMIVFVFRYPHPIGNPMKAVYAAPALLLLWVLLGAGIEAKRCPLWVLVLSLSAWTLLNAGLPVY